MLQYLPTLAEAGFEVVLAPFFDDAYLKRRYAGEAVGLATAGYFISRVRHVLSQEKPDLIWVEKEVFPWLPWRLERAILPHNIPLVSDYDDALFHRYDLHSRSVVRSLLGRKIDGVMGASNLVMAGNRYLADRAETASAKRIEIVPTVVDIDAYSRDRHQPADGHLRIGWIGSPTTWNDHCLPMLPMLTAVASRHGAMIRAVGAGGDAKPDQMLEFLPWSEKTEVPLIQSMDIGIMPLDDSPWARGKCGYKLIQYMACGLPVVASPVGVNKEIVEHGVNGFLAETDAQWAASVGTLLGNAELRRRMGAAGRKKIEREYSLQIFGPKVASMLLNTAHSRRLPAR